MFRKFIINIIIIIIINLFTYHFWLSLFGVMDSEHHLVSFFWFTTVLLPAISFVWLLSLSNILFFLYYGFTNEILYILFYLSPLQSIKMSRRKMLLHFPYNCIITVISILFSHVDLDYCLGSLAFSL